MRVWAAIQIALSVPCFVVASHEASPWLFVGFFFALGGALLCEGIDTWRHAE